MTEPTRFRHGTYVALEKGITMKKTTRKLRVQAENVRNLIEVELARVGGGMADSAGLPDVCPPRTSLLMSELVK